MATHTPSMLLTGHSPQAKCTIAEVIKVNGATPARVTLHQNVNQLCIQIPIAFTQTQVNATAEKLPRFFMCSCSPTAPNAFVTAVFSILPVRLRSNFLKAP